jgi:hypothetical protein
MALASGIGDTTGTVPAVGNWLAVNGTFSSLQIIYPIGSGPSIDTATANVYRLPHGFLRRAPVAPRASVNTYLGAPHLMFRDDAVEENGYLVSSFVGPRMLRYVRDFVDVQDMDVMFCEGLSARMALETVATGSPAATPIGRSSTPATSWRWGKRARPMPSSRARWTSPRTNLLPAVSDHAERISRANQLSRR